MTDHAGLSWRHARGFLSLAEPIVMGIVNVTPDSFSDGGQHADAAAAIEHGRRLLGEGAALVDVGGESTRPGAAPVPLEEELRRVLPVVEALAGDGAVVSIDTRKPAVARAALAAGAAIVNDVEGLRQEAMREVVAEARAGVVLMHMQGTPETMQADPRYEDVVGEVCAWLAAQSERAEAAGIDPLAIALDPGIGFGKGHEHNLALLRRLDALVALGYPVTVGVSRKRFLGALTGREAPGERVMASVACALSAVARGANILRVHDAAATVDALRVRAAIETPSGSPRGA